MIAAKRGSPPQHIIRMSTPTTTTTTMRSPHDNPHCRFHCNICLDAVNEPVVTQCGHLYCWPCLYQWLEPGIITSSEQRGSFGRPVCPVCKAPCSVSTVIPIYALVEQPRLPSRSETTCWNTGSVERDNSLRLIKDEEQDESRGSSPIRLRRIPARPSRPLMIPDASMNDREYRTSPSRPLARLYTHHSFSPSDPQHATEYLSRILLILGSFVILCLLLF